MHGYSMLTREERYSTCPFSGTSHTRVDNEYIILIKAKSANRNEQSNMKRKGNLTKLCTIKVNPSKSIKSRRDYNVKWPFLRNEGIPFYFQSFLVISVHYVVTDVPFYVSLWSPFPLGLACTVPTLPINNRLTQFTLKISAFYHCHQFYRVKNRKKDRLLLPHCIPTISATLIMMRKVPISYLYEPERGIMFNDLPT